RKDVQDPQTTYAETTSFLEARYGIVCLGRLGFENAYALALTRARAAKLGIRSIADLRRHAPRMRMAGDLQFFERSEWTRVRGLYGLTLHETRPMDATLMYQAVADDAV